MAQTKTPYDGLIKHYEGLLEEINTLYDICIDDLKKAKREERFDDYKTYVKLYSNLKAMRNEHRDGLAYWKIEAKIYINNKK